MNKFAASLALAVTTEATRTNPKSSSMVEYELITCFALMASTAIAAALRTNSSDTMSEQDINNMITADDDDL